MAKILLQCPACNDDLFVSTLTCGKCNLNLQNKFELNEFNYLTDEQMTFLLTFLKHQGNFKLLQEELNMTYASAKNKMNNLLKSLRIDSPNLLNKNLPEEVDIANLNYDFDSKLASDIIKKIMLDNGGVITATSTNGKVYEFKSSKDGKHFNCEQLPVDFYDYTVFDVLVDCLIKNGGTARKGNGRNYKLGDKNCDDSTLVGYLGRHYLKKRNGDSVYDPIFLLVPVLEYAKIAHNERGYVQLTKYYTNLID